MIVNWSIGVMKHKKSILVLDDDVKYKSLIENLLTKNNEYKVLLASDGDRILHTLEDKKGKIDLIVTDLIHPGMGGIELLHAIKEKYPAIKIIICTGLPMLHDDFKQNSDSILYKPFKFENLLEVIKNTLNS